MAIYSVYDVEEEHSNHDESWAVGSKDASVVLRCPWSIRHLVMADLLGNRREWPHGIGFSKPRVSTVSCVPDTSVSTVVGQCIVYNDALLTVAYSSEEEAELLSESLEPTIQFITEDYRKFRWGSGDGDPLLEGEAPGKQLRGINLVRNLYDVEGPLPQTLLTLMGSSNEEPYTSDLLGLTFDTEHLIYHPPPMNRTITTEGAEGWNLTLKFSFKEGGWNKYWRADTGEYEHIYLAGEDEPYKPYPPANYIDFLF